MEAQRLHNDALVIDTHNDLVLLIDHNDRRFRRQTFKEFWLPQLRSGGVNVQVLPICIEEQFQSEGALRRTLLLVERLHEIAAQHSEDVTICYTADDIDQTVAAGRIA